jgi:uncharacterized protein YjiS (DUF1127 family)
MRFPSFAPSVAATPLSRTEHRLAALARTIVGRFQAWRTRQTVLAELNRLDHWTLSDLRIHPCDFNAIAEGSYQRGGAASGDPITAQRERNLRLWPL